MSSGGDMASVAALDPRPWRMTSEGTPDDPDDWRHEAYFEGKPDKATIAAIRARVSSAGARKAKPEKVAEADWVTLSQAGLEPVRAGRFLVHTSAHGVAEIGRAHV